ncbi:Diphthamide biosynthesis protein 2, partial [Coemansia sp. RSA 2708]
MAEALQNPVAISDSGEAVLAREAVHSERRAHSATEAESVYEVERTAKLISDGGYKRVALQFPDELLADSTLVSDQLRQRVSAQIFVLADTSYGSCCVDEVAALHYDADLVVHYGRTCLSLTSRLPVVYVFCCEPVDSEHVAECAKREDLGESRLLLVADVPYVHALDAIADRLRPCVAEMVVSRVSAQDGVYVPGADTEGVKLGRTWELDHPVGDYTLLYIGDESPTLTNLLVTKRFGAAYSYSPSQRTLRAESGKANRHLSRRYYMVQRARDANIVGIVVGTLAAARYLRVVEALKQLLRQAERKFYVFVVGKLNVAKLANFAEIEAYVLVACPENSLVDSKEFFQPVVTPYEMLLALSRSREWSGDYITDFHSFLEESELDQDFGGDDDEPHFSLVTGKLQKTRRYVAQQDEPSGGDVTVRCKTEIAQYMGSAAAEHLLARSFRGLGHDDDSHEVEPMLAVDGLSGIASNTFKHIMRSETSSSSSAASTASSASSTPSQRVESFQAVWKLHCKHCHVLWSSRGMEAIVMARPAIRCFSTDLPPLGCDIVHQPVAPPIADMLVDSGCHTCSSLTHHARRFDLAPSGPCDCHVQDIACLGCGNIVGYYIHRPCFRCLAQRLRIKQRGFQHLWTFYQDNVVAVQRENEVGEPVGWEELPSPPPPMAS